MPYADLEQYKAKASYTTIDGHRIAHWQAGQGEFVLLLHGFPSASWDWHHQWAALSRSYTVIALDLLGYGLSDKPHPHAYSLLEQASIAESLLAGLDVKRCHVIAHNYGDSVAQELLSRSFTGASKLELISMTFLNGGLFAESHRPILTQKLLKGPLGPVFSRLFTKNTLRKGFTRIFASESPPKDAEIDAVWTLLCENDGRRVLPALLRYIDERPVHRDRWVAAMQETSTPLQFINGIEDPISGEHMLARYRELVPNPQTYPLALGHYPQLEGPDRVLALFEMILSKYRT